MKTVPASHGAVVNGLQPLSSRSQHGSRTRPSKGFWLAAVAGSAIVVAFALQTGGGGVQAGDLLMLVAVAIGALGYAEGARLARQIGSWPVICWALVVSAPFLVLPVGWLVYAHHAAHPEPLALRTWLAFGYVTLFHSSSAFSRGTPGWRWAVSPRVGQVQLLQIFFTMALSAPLFGEKVDTTTWIYAAAVIATVVVGRRTAVRGGVGTPITTARRSPRAPSEAHPTSAR